MRPWELTPELTSERIYVLRDAVLRVRGRVAAMFGPVIRETRFGFSCTAAHLTQSEIKALVQEHDWLHVHSRGMRYSAFVGKVMVKLYRGEGEPRWDRLQRVQREIGELQQNPQLDWLGAEEHAGWFWYMRVEDDRNGKVTDISMLRCHTDGTVTDEWQVPLDTNVIPIKAPPARKLGKPVLRLEEADSEFDEG